MLDKLGFIRTTVYFADFSKEMENNLQTATEQSTR